MFSGSLRCSLVVWLVFLSLMIKTALMTCPKLIELSESKQTGILINANQQFILATLGQREQPNK